MSLDLAKVQGHLFEMWPLVPLLAVKVATFLASPTHLVGAGMRLLTGPYHDQWFFWRSEYSHTIWGAISFVSDRTARLFKGLLEPGFSPDTADMRVLWILVLIVMAIVWIVLAIRMMQRRLDAKMSFLVVFTAVSLTGIAVGGLLGLYPYGRNRYAYFLLLPMTILLGYAISSLVGWGMAKVPRIQPLAQSRALPVMIAVVVLASGIAYNVHQCRHHLTITNENQTALREIGGTSADLVLVSGYGRVFVKPMYPDLYARAYDMGMGKSGSGFVREPDESVPTEVARVITGTDGVLEDTLLVVDVSMDHWLDEYPSWAELVVEQFDMSSEIVAPDIWSGCYTRKQA